MDQENPQLHTVFNKPKEKSSRRVELEENLITWCWRSKGTMRLNKCICVSSAVSKLVRAFLMMTNQNKPNDLW